MNSKFGGGLSFKFSSLAAEVPNTYRVAANLVPGLVHTWPLSRYMLRH